jgi:hypothetical protein
MWGRADGDLLTWCRVSPAHGPGPSFEPSSSAKASIIPQIASIRTMRIALTAAPFTVSRSRLPPS